MRGLSMAGIVLCARFCQAFLCFAIAAKTRRCEANRGGARRPPGPRTTATLKPCPAANAGIVLATILIPLPFPGLRAAHALGPCGMKGGDRATVTRLPF